MATITTDKIVEIHDYVIKRFGGSGGILNLGTVDFLIFELSKQTDEFEKAAIVLNRIITGHPFMDGHKRTAFQVADLILREEGYHIHADSIEIEQFLLKIAKYNCNISEIKNWLKKRCWQLKKSRQLQFSQTYH